MRWLWGVVVAGVCCAVGLAQTPQPRHEAKAAAGGHFEIKGVVVNSVDGNPVAHCHLTATLTGNAGGRPGMMGGFRGGQFPAPSNDSVDCDAQGKFVMTVPSAGAWRVTANARGFVSADYDQHEQFSSAIVLTADAPTKELEFKLSPEAAIAGRVIDEAGEAVRNAQIMLQTVPPQTPGGPQPAGTTRGATRTDDRGMYELANLAPGEYRLSVTAQPWYVAGSQVTRAVAGATDSNAPATDPSLDLTYAQTWFPGVDDPTRAEVIKLRAGDTRQADFNLIPIPSIHLRILTPPRQQQPVLSASVGSQPIPPPPAPQPVPMVQRVSSGGGGFVQTTMHFNSQGEVDVGGLTPGVYQVRLSGQDGRAALVEVSTNGMKTVDMNSPPHDMARITLRVDGVAADADPDVGLGNLPGNMPQRNGGAQVVLIDPVSHGSFFANQSFAPNGARREKDANTDRVIEVPPGRYEVVLQGRGNVFLTGLSAKGAETAGRYVTVGAGDSTLTVHTASGRASVSGIATLDGKPLVGAMMLLVPVTIEDANSITMLRQDQTNTDGSFDIANVIPGQYILVGIDHGWGMNWGDPSTLRRYLMEGIPLDLKSSAVVKQNIDAQAP